MINIEKLRFSFGSRRILRGIDVSIAPGEKIGLVGANGAGKTTLLKILSGIMMPDEGSVAIDGVELSENPIKYRSFIGYLSESATTYEDMRVKEYLAFRAKLKGEAPKRLRRRLAEALELCHLDEVPREFIGNLSAGWRKRVALADALLMRPRFLLLDDFFAGFDISLRDEFSGIIGNVAAFSSVIVSGHELGDIIKCSGKILILKNGCAYLMARARNEDAAAFERRIREAVAIERK